MNNFDTSSQGVELELHCNMDDALASFYFDELMHVLQYRGYAETFTVVFHSGDECDYPKELSELADWYTLTDEPKLMFKQLLEYSGADVRDLLSEIHDTHKSINDMNQYEMKDFIETYLYDAWLEFCEEYGDPEFVKVISRGYSQGSYAEVLVPKQIAANYNDTELSDHISNLLWDSPVYCRLSVDDEEHYLDEALESQYKWDASKIMEYAKTKLVDHPKFAYIIEWLECNIPEYPDHVY